MDTLSKIDIKELIKDYPNPSAIMEFGSSDFSKYLSQIAKIAEEYGEVKSFPGGVEGYLLFLMLANKTIISAQESDFEDFTFEDLNIYKHSYQRLHIAVKERFQDVFK